MAFCLAFHIARTQYTMFGCKWFDLRKMQLPALLIRKKFKEKETAKSIVLYVLFSDLPPLSIRSKFIRFCCLFFLFKFDLLVSCARLLCARTEANSIEVKMSGTQKSTNCVCTKWIQSKVSSVRCIKKCRANCFNPQQKRTNERTHTHTHTP